ncbi:hypothetical protein DEU47_104707 [Bacillus sp. AG236]|nr:hypothetical protein DEU47_104707 [Bacillus sp. AG236]
MSSKVCEHYIDRIKKEVIELQETHNYFIVKGIENLDLDLPLKEKYKYKELTAKGLAGEVTLRDIVDEHLNINNQMRLVYLMSLWESFVKEFIKEQEIPQSYISVLDSLWKREIVSSSDKILFGSPSNYNIRYITYLFRNLYSINFNIPPAQAIDFNCYGEFLPIARELGHLRNSIIHDGTTVTEISAIQLTNIIKLSVKNEGNELLGYKIKIKDRLIYIACYLISDIIKNIQEYLANGSTLNTDTSTYSFQQGKNQN